MSGSSNSPAGAIEQRIASLEGHVLVLQEKSDEQQRIIDAQQKVIEELRTLLLGKGKILQEDSRLTPKQEKIFQALEAIKGNGKNELELAQAEFLKLKGERATKVLVKGIQDYLKSREWGIEVKGDIAAAPGWQVDRGRREGGYMRLSYFDTEAGRSVGVHSFTRLPFFHLLSRPDRRRTRHD